MKLNHCFFFFLFSILTAGMFAQNTTGVTHVGTTNPSVSAYVMGTGEQLSGQQFQTDGILTYKGYQYTVYYNLTRNVTISRRKLPLGAWEEVVLPHRNSANDAHNTISIGISAKDGRIHLSFDHHNDVLHYCYSIVGSANDPGNMPWGTASFSATSDIMDKAVPNVTYPRFISKPDGNLLFECRFRWSGYGDSYLREYNADTQTWSLVGRYVQGENVSPDACAYINGMTYDKQGRLHVTWCWRDDFGGGSNHDFYYAFSEDHGRTWKDTKEVVNATTDIMDPVFDNQTKGAIGQTKKSFMVEAIPYNRGYINQETQDVDSKGRIHAVNSHIPDGQADDANWESSRTKARLHHRFRKEDGTWVKRLITVNGNSVNSTRRVHLLIDSYDNAWVIANGYGVIMASPADDYAAWTLISEDGKSGYLSEPLSDRPLLRDKGVLSFVYLSSSQKITVFDYLTRNPDTPAGTGLSAEYFSNENFTGLISSQLVTNPGESTVPSGTKSIRWSGTFETLLGEKYTLHLNTAAKTNVYINDRLQKVISQSATAQDYDIQYQLISSHKNNIVIESVGASPAVLSWSGAGTTKQSIPVSSLYPVKSNDKPGGITPPNLTTKAELDIVLSDAKKKISTSAREVTNITPFDPPAEYSLEVKTKILAAEGRGLDIETRGKSGKGFRVSLDETSINFSTPLTASTEISAVDNSSDQVYRFAVKDDKVHIYLNQEYLGSKNTDFIRNILENDQESESAGTYGVDIIGNWAGPSGTGTGIPTAYGWDASGATVAWNTANGSSGVRYLDVSSASSPNHLLNGNVFTGRLLTVRWDGTLASNVYYYPVTLEANTSYEFSMVYEHWNNGAIGAPITAGISQSKTQAGIYSSASYATIEKNRLQQASFRFSSREAGQYYITFTGASGTMFGIGRLQLRSLTFENRLQIGKNYNGGNIDADIYYVTYQEGAYAPSTDGIAGPELPVKEILPTEILGATRMNAPTGSKSIQTLAFNPSGDYTLEIAATIESSEGRGLDFETRNGEGNGFRTSLASESFRWASPFAGIRQISRSDNSKQTIRYAVQGNQVHIYKNMKFAESFNLVQTGNMDETGAAELAISTTKPVNMYDGVNLISNADFKNDAHNAAPTGWTSDKTMGVSPNPRIQEKSQTTELSAYPDGKKAFMFRFDASGGTYYAYQVLLKTNRWHELSFDLITWGANPAIEYDVVIATIADGTAGVIKTQRVKTPAIRATAERQMIRFQTTTDAAVIDMPFYIVFKKVATVGTMAVTDLYLKEGGINQLLFGKNYTEGAAVFSIDYIRVDYSGAFAPATFTSETNLADQNSFYVYSSENKLIIRNISAGDIINIFDVQGRKILHKHSDSELFSAGVSSGLYLVRVNDKVSKVIVK